MTTTIKDNSINTRALEAIESFSRLSKPQQIVEAMGACLSPLGTEFFSISFLPTKGQGIDEVMLTSRLPSGWLALYADRGFVEFDPTLRHCKNVVQPFEWHEAPYDSITEPRSQEVAERVRDFGLTKGLFVPIPGPSGSIGLVWMGGCEFELTARDKPILHMIGLYAFESMRHMVGRPQAKSVRLTKREREILTWIAGGKSAGEIGDVLNLSYRTVEWHIGQAAAKLQAKNRVQAVMIAYRDQLIAI